MLHIATCPRITPSCCCSGSSPRSQVKIKSFPLIDKNNVEVTSFINAIFQEIRGEDADSRPLLILVNPNSGSGAAKRRYEAEVAPYFKKMNLATEVLVTTRAGHAKEIGSKIDASKYRGIVTASGDGLLYEVLQGILSRKDDAIATIRKLKLGVLPLGSGNGLAASILKDANESDITDLLSSAFLIARGASRDIDIAAIETSSKSSEVLYSFLCLEWALFADIDIESEWLRCCGSARFTFWGVWRIMCCLRRYRGTFSWLPSNTTKDQDVSIGMKEDEDEESKSDDDFNLLDRKILPPLNEPVRYVGFVFVFSLSLSLSLCLFIQTNKQTHTHTHRYRPRGVRWMESLHNFGQPTQHFNLVIPWRWHLTRNLMTVSCMLQSIKVRLAVRWQILHFSSFQRVSTQTILGVSI